jgi:large subunit ribosomal protein L18
MQQSLSRTFKPLHLKLFLSNKYAYAQIVRMIDGHIVAAASTVEAPLREAATKRGVDRGACSK